VTPWHELFERGEAVAGEVDYEIVSDRLRSQRRDGE
jgi:hypothetical protein